MIIVTTALPGRHRMTIAVTLALVLHAAVIIGVRYQPLDAAPQVSPPLHVTLQTQANRIAPTEPAPEAATDNLGGGEADPVPTTVSDGGAGESTTVIASTALSEPQTKQPIEAPAELTVEELPEESEQPANLTENTTKRRPSATSLMRQARQIAMSMSSGGQQRTLNAGQDNEAQGTSTKYSVREAYIQSWVLKVQAWGNRNFPEEARRGGLTGSLTLSVTLWADGSIADMRLVRTSGHQVLDEAARRIVTLAAPYAPFPQSLRSEYGDSLTIKRTWQFLQGNRLTSG